MPAGTHTHRQAVGQAGRRCQTSTWNCICRCLSQQILVPQSRKKVAAAEGDGAGAGKGAANGHEDIGGNGNDERQRERHLLFTLIISSKFENIYIGIPSSERDVDIYTCLSLSLSRNPLLRLLLLPPLFLLRLLGNCKLSCYSPASLSLPFSLFLSLWAGPRQEE